VALFHDIIIVSGAFVIFGKYLGYEVDVLFVTALLTTLGYSVNDTIVTFDRVRDNITRDQDEDFDVLVNKSVNQTIIRSINTGITTLLVLLAIFVFGGGSIKPFVLALMTGVLIGTYSSIFLASPLLVTLYKLQKK
ncbi:protein translocase subunit SecF, partial [Patescibacteria group bacterium]